MVEKDFRSTLLCAMRAHAIWFVLAAAFLLRLGWVLAVPSEQYTDSVWYDAAACEPPSWLLPDYEAAPGGAVAGVPPRRA